MVIDIHAKNIDSITTVHESLFNINYPRESFLFDIEDSNSIFRGIFCNDELIGYYCLKVMVDEAEIITIAIKKEFQGKGYGTLLIEDMFSQAKNNSIKKIFLEVSEHNSVAQSLYYKFGFKHINTRYFYYGKGNNAFILEKGLI